MALSPDQIAAHDPRDMYGSIALMPEQIAAAWEAIAGREFPDRCRDVDHVVVAGMGGSAIGTHLVQSVFRDRLRVPITIVSDYTLPSWVDQRTLILLSSYSGTTEEVLAVAERGLADGNPMVALSTGGTLADLAAEHDLPAVVFTSEHNPCGQPRIGLGYAATYQLGMFRQLGVIDLADDEVEAALAAARSASERYRQLDDANPAMALAQQAEGKALLLFAAEHLVGSAHIWANQWNENAKKMAAWFALPELNHHLMEGLTGPPEVRDRLFAAVLASDLYDGRIQQRVSITRQVLGEQQVESLEVRPEGATLLAQAFDTLLLGGFAGFFSAMLSEIDPSPIPWVDHFKGLMAKG